MLTKDLQFTEDWQKRKETDRLQHTYYSHNSSPKMPSLTVSKSSSTIQLNRFKLADRD